MRLIRTLLIFLLLCQPVLAVPATYIVTHLGRTGNVPGDGGTTAGGNGSTLAEAMSLAKAALIASIEPGDTLSLYDDDGSFGDFALTTSHQFGTAWTEGNYITVSPGLGETVTFTQISWSLTGAAQNIYWKFDGIDGRIVINVGQLNTSKSALNATGGAQVLFQNCIFSGGYKDYTGWDGGNCFPLNSTLIYMTSAWFALYPAHDITLRNCELKNSSSIISASRPVYNIEIDDCTIHGWGGDLYAGSSQHFTFTDNDCTDNDSRRNPYRRNGGSESGLFTIGEVVTQAGSGATGKVDIYNAPYTYFHLTSVTPFNATGTITGSESGSTISGQASVEGVHGDGLQVFESYPTIDGVTTGSPTGISTTSYAYIKTGDRVLIVGLTNASPPGDEAELNDHIFYAKYETGGMDITLWNDAACTSDPVNTTGKDIVDAGSGDYCIPVIKDLLIARNKFHDMDGTASIYFENASGNGSLMLPLDGCTVESNLIYGEELTRGMIVAGAQSVGPGTFKINNNTFIAKNAEYSINNGFEFGIYSTRGSTLVDEMLGNIIDRLNIMTDAGGYGTTITSHDYNTIAQKVDVSSHWTKAANETIGAATSLETTATFFADYFTNYAGNVYTLKAGSPAIDAGSALGATYDINGVAFGETPDQGCYKYTAAPGASAIFFFINGD